MHSTRRTTDRPVNDDERAAYIAEQAARAIDEQERVRRDEPLTEAVRARFPGLIPSALDDLAEVGEDPLTLGPGPAGEYARAAARHRAGLMGPRRAKTKTGSSVYALQLDVLRALTGVRFDGPLYRVRREDEDGDDT